MVTFTGFVSSFLFAIFFPKWYNTKGKFTEKFRTIQRKIYRKGVYYEQICLPI